MYQTRMMVANVAMRHEGRDLQPGDPFEATLADRSYYTMVHYARDQEPPPAEQVARVEPPRRAGRPTNAERAARMAAAGQGAPQEPTPPAPPPADPPAEQPGDSAPEGQGESN
jgi:hypothetical protein